MKSINRLGIVQRVKHNKYAQTIDAEIDLHGKTVHEAEVLVCEFLKSAHLNKFARVRIITGKGNHTGGKSVVRDAIRKLLQKGKYSFRPAKISEGGGGAYIVSI